MRLIDSNFKILFLCLVYCSLLSIAVSQQRKEALSDRIQASGDGSGDSALGRDDEDSTLGSGAGPAVQPTISVKVTSIAPGRTGGSRDIKPTQRTSSSITSQPRRPDIVKPKPSTKTPPIYIFDSMSCKKTRESQSPRLPYKPTCHPRFPALYKSKQCSIGRYGEFICFCVNTKTGKVIQGTRFSNQMARQLLQCSKKNFNITLGFSMPFDPQSMGHSSSQNYRQFAQRIEKVVNGVYDNLPGLQTTKLLKLRRGSVIALLQVSSVGHTATGSELRRTLKEPIDELVSGGTIDGLSVIPSYYTFRGADEPLQGRNTVDSGGNPIVDQSVDDNLSKSGSGGTGPSASSENAASPAVDNNGLEKMKKLIEQPILLGVIIAGGVALIVILILAILYCVYRVRKADEGSYALDEPKKAPLVNVYQRAPTREFYA